MLALLELFASCRCRPETVYITKEAVEIKAVKHVDTIVSPPDSAMANALLECTEKGKVIMSFLETATTKNADMRVRLDSIGNLEMEAIVVHDTVYAQRDSVIVNTRTTVRETEYVEKELSKWQAFLLRFGGVVFWVLSGGALCGIVMLCLKVKR